jgi:hypothetical protein
MRPARSIGAVGLLIALALPPAAGAQQRLGTTLGNHVPNANFDCRWRPSAIGPQFFGGPDTCTYLSSTPGPQSTGAPGSGVIIRAFVRAGAPVGPMQVTVARAIRSLTAGFTCCFYNGESQVFTPRPNAITTIPMRLPVTAQIDFDAGVEVVDYLALTVLGNNIAIPGQIPGSDGFEGSLGFFPRLNPQDSANGRVDGYGNSLIPLLAADFVPICTGGGAGSARAAQGGRCMGALSFRGGGGGLNGSTAFVPLLCNITIQCQGRLSLRSLGGTRIGSAGVQIGPGGRRFIAVGLNNAGQNLVRGRNRVKVRARAKIGGVPAAKRKVTLRR